MPRNARVLLRTVAGASLLVVQGCGGGGGSSGGEAELSAITVEVGDGPSELVTSFTVGVDAISVTRDTGEVVDLLAQPATIDLATLASVSQALGTVELHSGRFVGASLTLDFTSSRCILAGQTAAATLLDEQGQPLTGVVTLPLDLTRAPFVAFSRQHHGVEFDFDLDQSLTIDPVANSVVVDPSIVLRVDRLDARTILACGSIQDVSPGTGTATIELESPSGASLVPMTLAFDVSTVFQIDGAPSSGGAGVTALAAKPAGTWIEAYGAIDGLRHRMNVFYLEAGTATWNGGQDLVDGVIVDRSGVAGADPTLTVFGWSSDAAHDAFQFATTFTVAASFASTAVIRTGSTVPIDADSLVVGQAIRAYGKLSGATLDATAAGSLARENATPITGHAVGGLGGADGTTLTLDVATVAGLDVSAFVWADGGTTPPDPTQFTIELGTLAKGVTITDGEPLRIPSFLTNYSDATTDAVGITFEDLGQAEVLLVLRDRADGFTVTTTAANHAVDFAIVGAPGSDEAAEIDAGFLGTQPLVTSPDPTIVKGAVQTGYMIHHLSTGETQYYRVFDDFVSSLASALAGGETLRDCAARGTLDGATNSFHASVATIVVD